MSSEVYCYHCRKSHPKEEMRLLVTKTGKRWRCAQSIAAAKGANMAQREVFGKRVTEENKAKMQALRGKQANP